MRCFFAPTLFLLRLFGGMRGKTINAAVTFMNETNRLKCYRLKLFWTKVILSRESDNNEDNNNYNI